MGNIFREVVVVIRLWNESLWHHSGSDLERRIDAHRADHDHSEYDERYDDEDKGRVDTFLLHNRLGMEIRKLDFFPQEEERQWKYNNQKEKWIHSCEWKLFGGNYYFWF